MVKTIVGIIFINGVSGQLVPPGGGLSLAEHHACWLNADAAGRLGATDASQGRLR
jgi:hypothetical protein